MQRGIIQYNDNLCSINPVANDFSGRLFIDVLLSNLFSRCPILCANFSHLNYSLDAELGQLKDGRPNISELLINSRTSEVSFYYRANDKHIGALSNVLTNLWFGFEQPCLCFLQDEYVPIINRRTAWSDITSKTISFVIYRDVEDETVWLGKSKELSFDDVLFSPGAGFDEHSSCPNKDG